MQWTVSRLILRLTRGERVPGWQLGKQRKIPIPGKQGVHAVRDADGRDTGVVNHATDNARAIHEALQDNLKIFGFADHPV